MNIGADYGTRFNLTQIVSLKAWLRDCGFPRAALFMFRENDRNLVFLRIRVEQAVADIEIAWLDDVRREKLDKKTAQRRVMDRFELQQEASVA